MALLELYRKVAMFFVVILILSCVAFADDPGVASCTSVICQEVGEEIITSIDNTVDACTDFFQHACGGWMVRHPVTDSVAVSTQFLRVELKLDQVLKDLLESDEARVEGAIQTDLLENDEVEGRDVIRKFKDFYKSCMDLVTIDSMGLQPVMAILTANGDWPLTVPRSKWNPQHLTWQQIHENFMKVTEYAALFSLSVGVNRINSKSHVITLQATYTSENRLRTTNVWKRETTKRSHFVKRTSFEKYVLRTALEFTKSKGSNVTAADVESDVTEMLAFREELRNAYMIRFNSNLDDKYRIITINEAQDIWNTAVNNDTQYKVDWLETIRKRFEGTGIVIDENEKLAIRPGVYFQRLATLLSKTPVRTIVNYIHWYAIDNLLQYGDEAMRRILLWYIRKRENVSEFPKRWLMCSAFPGSHDAVSLMYVRSHFPKQTRTSVIEMIDELREASKEAINKCNWMGENERTLAKEKIDAMKNRIGYPDWYDVPGKIDEYYNELTVGPNYLENVLAANRFYNKILLRNLRKPFDLAQVGSTMEPMNVNAKYFSSSNSLDFPAAIFQMPIYHYKQPAALKFGGMGSIIGHEISHAFDNTEQLKGEDGQRWANSTIDAYKEKVECFVTQYSQYEITKNSSTDEPIYVNGKKILEESVADNLGFSMSFKAFQRYKNLHPNEINNIPALKNYSEDKLFFYGLANTFCEVVRPTVLEFISPNLPHSVNKVRINGVLSNMEQFASTFECPAGSKMNPTNKCVLWD